eukprot:7415308-Prorocentrum_lima.AAC.1
MKTAPGRWLDYDLSRRHPDWADYSLRSNSHARGEQPPAGRQHVEMIIENETIIAHPRQRD